MPDAVAVTGHRPRVRMPCRQRPQNIGQFGTVPGGHGGTYGTPAGAPRQGPGHVGGVRGAVAQPAGQSARRVAEALGVEVGEQVQAGRGFLGRPGGDQAGRPLLQHHMRVGAAEAEPGDPRDSGAAIAGPGLRLGHHPQPVIGQSAALRAVQGRRDAVVVQGQHGLHQAGDTRGRLQMTEVSLDGTQQQRLVRVTVNAEHRAERARLDRVAQRRAGAVRLDVVDMRRGEPCPCVRAAQQRLLSGRVGRHEAVRAAVGVDGGGADDGQDAVAVPLGVGQPLEDHGRAALAAPDAVRRRRERLAPPVRREGSRSPEGDRDGR